MLVNEKNAKTWSRMGSRATFGTLALELGEKIDNLMIVTADVSTSAGLDRFKKNYPDKYLDVGIAEQNLIGVAAGLASENFTVMTTTFAPFQTMRCCEQIKVNLGYMKQGVCMIGLASGVVLGTLGYTHCCIEDLSIMRSIPGMTVISPADCGETVKSVIAAIDYGRPTYIRLTGGSKNPTVYEKDFDFEIGKAIHHREGGDVALIATGTMVRKSIDAADLLAEKGISAAVVDMHTIKPIDSAVIEKLCRETKLIVTVEEHSIIGGLGSAVSEVKTTLAGVPPQILIGLPDQYGPGGEYEDLLEDYGLTTDKISETVATGFKQYCC